MARRILPHLALPRVALLPIPLVVTPLLLASAGCHKQDTPQPVPSAGAVQAPAGQETPENQRILDDFNRRHPGMVQSAGKK